MNKKKHKDDGSLNAVSLPPCMTEKERMLAGETYSAVDPQLLEELAVTREVVYDYNQLRPSENEKKLRLLKELLGHIGDDEIIINQPFRCDYGKQISVGKRFFANFNFTVLDEARVTIGDDCFIGPNVSIYTACHSTDPIERNSRREWAEPITIGNNVWIGGSVTILPGVTIGDNVTIGAGSVVTKDIPSNSVAVGNPCKVIKAL
jgi:maltose O-acetyltransferase